jgi:hypothetical protein
MPHLLAQIIPETGWVKFTPAEREQLLDNLDGFGVYGPPASAYLRAHATTFGYLPQTASSAGWTLRGNLTLRPGTDLSNQRILAVIIHEVLHLQQPLSMRLSIQGELLAWQLEYQAYHAGTGTWYGDLGAPFAGTKPQWEALSQLSPHSHEHLAKAQGLMKAVSPVYRAHLLPLYPLGREAGYRLANSFRRPKS